MLEKRRQRFDTRWQRVVLWLHLATEPWNDCHCGVKSVSVDFEAMSWASSSLRDWTVLFDKRQHAVESTGLIHRTRLTCAHKLQHLTHGQKTNGAPWWSQQTYHYPNQSHQAFNAKLISYYSFHIPLRVRSKVNWEERTQHVSKKSKKHN